VFLLNQCPLVSAPCEQHASWRRGEPVSLD
jgi:hypothetical protein